MAKKGRKGERSPTVELEGAKEQTKHRYINWNQTSHINKIH